MPSHPQLQTDRLFLRKLTLRDTDAVFSAYAQDAEVTHYLSWKPHLKKLETETLIKRFVVDDHAGLSFTWVIEQFDNAELSGMIDLKINDSKTTMGFLLARPFWGKGFATEASCAVIDWSLREAEFKRIESFCDKDNADSVRVLEKSGMKRERLLRRFGVHPNLSSSPRDCWRFGLSRTLFLK